MASPVFKAIERSCFGPLVASIVVCCALDFITVVKLTPWLTTLVPSS